MSDEDPFKAFDSAIGKIGEVKVDELEAAEKEERFAEATERLAERVNREYTPEKLAEVIDSCVDDLFSADLRGWPPVGTELVLKERFGYHNVWEITARRVR